MTTDITPSTILKGIYYPGLFLMSAADLNGDGRSDIVFNGGSLPSDAPVAAGPMIFVNQGQGNFTQMDLGDGLHDLVHPREFGFSDFNGDGHRDILIAAHGHDTDPFPGESNTLLLSDGNGGYFDASSNLPSVADFSHSLAIADIDGDGDQDVYIGNVAGQLDVPPYLLLNDGVGNFTRQNLNPDLFDAFRLPSTVSFFDDLNRDSIPELILGAYSGNPSRILSYDVDKGDFTLQQNLPAALFGARTVSHDIKTADLNNDGLMDIVIAQAEFEDRKSGLQILLQEQDGGFSDQTETFMQRVEIGSEWIQFFEFMDVNDDGLADIVTDRSSVHGPSAFVNTGGSFIPVTADVSIWSAAEFTTLLDAETKTVLGVKTYDGVMEIAEIPLSFYGANVSVTNESGITRTGTDGDDVMNGAVARDNLKGSSGNDVLNGMGGDDLLEGQDGNDTINGGDGTDTAVFLENQSKYSIAINKNGTVTVSDRNASEGQDTLTDIESVKFADTTLDLTQFVSTANLTADQFKPLAEMYAAYFNRTPDATGLYFWADKLAEGLSLNQIAELFFDQAETRALYTDPSNTDVFVTAVYDNVLGRTPDVSGFDFWKGQVSSGNVSQGAFVLEVIQGAKNGGSAADVQYLSQKTDLGIYFSAIKGMSDVADATAVFQTFGEASTSNLAGARAEVDQHYSDATTANGGDFLFSVIGVIDDPFSGTVA